MPSKRRAPPRPASRKRSDPVIKLITEVEKRLLKFNEAAKVANQLAAKVGDVADLPAVRPPPEFRHELPDAMASEDFLKKACQRLRKRLKERIRHYRDALRKNPRSPIAPETTEHLDADKKKLALLPSAERKMLAALRKERARVNRLWRATGYGNARHRLLDARYDFDLAKFRVANAEPITVDDAVAIVRWAAIAGGPKSDAWSYWDFQQTCGLLGKAHKILAQSQNTPRLPTLQDLRAEIARREAMRKGRKTAA